MEKKYSRKRDEKVVDEPKSTRQGKAPKRPTKTTPREMTPLMLVNEIAKIFCNTIREHDKNNSMPDSHRSILFHLAQDGLLTQLELAEKTHLKPPTISVSLVKLEKEGYVIREIGQDDARKTYVTLTEKGKSVDKEAMKQIKKLEASTSKNLSSEEIAILIKLLSTMRDSMLDDGAINL